MKFAYLIEPPFNFIGSDGQVSGCDVELAHHVFKELEVGKFEPIEAEFSELLPGLVTGRWRMTTGLFSTDERRASACFSRPIWALSDGLLVTKGNPLGLLGYRSIAENEEAVLGVIRDQIQHRYAISFNVQPERIRIFETYADAASAVCEGSVDAYASVGRAHSSFIDQHPNLGLELISVDVIEKPPAFGSFAFDLSDKVLCTSVDEVLSCYLGSEHHRSMARRYGFLESEVDLVAGV